MILARFKCTFTHTKVNYAHRFFTSKLQQWYTMDDRMLLLRLVLIITMEIWFGARHRVNTREVWASFSCPVWGPRWTIEVEKTECFMLTLFVFIFPQNPLKMIKDCISTQLARREPSNVNPKPNQNKHNAVIYLRVTDGKQPIHFHSYFYLTNPLHSKIIPNILWWGGMSTNHRNLDS